MAEWPLVGSIRYVDRYRHKTNITGPMLQCIVRFFYAAIFYFFYRMFIFAKLVKGVRPTFFLQLVKAKLYSISIDTHQLHYIPLHHFMI